jgi:probable HAF family extracellular repeat protein
MSMHAGARTGSTVRLRGRLVRLSTVVIFVTLGSAPRATRTPENHALDAMRQLPFAAAFDKPATFDDGRHTPPPRHPRGDRGAPRHSDRDEFEVIDLGTLGGSFSQARAVNAGGQVVGDSQTAGDAERHAFSWTATGGMIDLGTLGGTTSSIDFKYPLGVVNDSGQIVGSSSIAGDIAVHAFSWTATGGMIDLGTLGGSSSGAKAVNATGQVVGVAATADDELHAFSWTVTGGMIDLGTLGGSFIRAVAVTDSGQVVGSSTTAGDAETHAFSWTATGGMIDLGTLGGSFSEAKAVNASGQVVGDSSTAGDAETHAFSWTATGGMIDLGTLPGGTSALPAAVNASGRVVGQASTPAFSVHAFSWTVSEGMVDLGTFGGNSSLASAVNASGQVVGSADRTDASRHAFVWTASRGLVDLGTALRGSFVDATAINDSGQIVGASSEPGDATAHAVLWQPKQQKFTITSVTAHPSSLWPANHKMVPVSLSVSTSDDSASCQITDVSSNEGFNWPGQLDWAITGPLTLNLRAERSGAGKGRVYSITVTCTNASHLSDTKDVTVNVPHHQGK